MSLRTIAEQELLAHHLARQSFPGIFREASGNAVFKMSNPYRQAVRKLAVSRAPPTVLYLYTFVGINQNELTVHLNSGELWVFFVVISPLCMNFA